MIPYSLFAQSPPAYMDASEVLRIIGALNTRTLQAERRQARSEQELVAIRESLSQSRSELEEIVRLTELLYEVNRRMGSMMDYLFKEQGIKHGFGDAESFNLMFDLVVKGVDAEEAGQAPKCEKCEEQGGDPTGSRASAPAELNSGSGVN
ncbi:hypothetical protein N7508_007457 [Penicillium antarcticum]|uniref:uncharacterized protein n=1 Tax=Penicillium antarcticum TaxID=416450 RepID=UPI0023A7846A|nr:uncharacterized protein N7508_007457 [Penicillium antarcticum]KAJ5300214.1 hypothetical protein N7508_007457 [Penicillium antarcticum]